MYQFPDRVKKLAAGGGGGGGGRRQMEDEPNSQNYWLAWHNVRMCSSPSNATTKIRSHSYSLIYQLNFSGFIFPNGVQW